ncbi:MAG: hypothetical protein K2G70_02795 [Turicibacter sp.]|nr:hypothetical protein [Turicibacter sp.]
MHCTVCENHLSEMAKFCGKCGTSIEQMDFQSDSFKSRVEREEFSFVDEKHIGRLRFKQIITNVSIEDSIMRYKQNNITLYYFQKDTFETEHNIHDFVAVKCSWKVDLFFLILGIIELMIAFDGAEILWLLSAGLSFWVGLGVKMIITKSNGAKIMIEENSRSKCENFIQRLVEVNRSIVIK